MKSSSLIGHVVGALCSIVGSPYPADGALGTFFRQRSYLGSRDRKFIAETVYGVLREQRLCRHVLEETEHVLDGATPEGAILLEVSAYVLAVRPRPDIRAEDILDLLGEGEDVDRFRSALESLQNRAPVSTEGLDAGIRWSFPEWMVARLGAEFGSARLPALLEANNQPAPLTIRVNTLKTTPDECVRSLALEGISARASRLVLHGLTLEKRLNVFSLKAFRDGWFEVQDEGSQLLAHLADPKPTFRVLDMCAGAGGKTLALSAIMRNRGELVATDISPSRLKELQKRMRRAGAGNIRVRERFLQEEHEEQFDLVFVDAPCTGTGTLRRNPGMKWTVTAAMVAELSKKQQEILRKAAGYVKPGGTLLYATCSLFRDENETVVGEFLGSNSGFALEDPAPRVERLGLTDAIEERFVKLLPHVHNTDGFFCAFLKRTDAVPPPA